MTRTLPPVSLTCKDFNTAREHQRRLFHGRLSWALLNGTNLPRESVPTQIPNGTPRVRAVGGEEVQVLAALDARIDEGHIRQAMTEPGTEARQKADDALDRMEAHRLIIQAQIDALDTSPRRPGGHPDRYLVTVPALHVRIGGVEYVADLWRGVVVIDLATPRLGEYLGWDDNPGHQADSQWPLYAVRSDRTGLQRARGASEWHVDLIAALWPSPALPELVESMAIEDQTSA